MDSIKEFIFTVAGALLFVAAVTLFMSFAGRVSEMSDAVSRTDGADTSIAAVSAQEHGEPVITYSDVVAELFTDSLQYDLEIDGKLYTKKDYNLARYDVSGIPERATYRRSCIYDDDGVLVKVYYWSN